MKHLLLVFILLVGNLIIAQDHIVDERFDPLDYQPSNPITSSNSRLISSWGLNTNLFEDDELINVWGSNAFTLSYKYDVHLFEGIHWNVGIGYNWDNYNLKIGNYMLLHDSISHDKAKLGVQNVVFKTAIRFQSSKDLKKAFYLEVGSYINVKTFAKYTTWDEVAEMKLKNEATSLNYVTPFYYGVEAKLGYGVLSLYAKYRLSDIFESTVNYKELPILSIGVVIEVWDLE